MLDLLPSTWDLLVSLLDGLDEKTGNLPEVRVRIARVDTVIKLAGALEVDACELLRGITWISGTYRPGAFRQDSQKQAPGSSSTQ